MPGFLEPLGLLAIDARPPKPSSSWFGEYTRGRGGEVGLSSQEFKAEYGRNEGVLDVNCLHF